MSSQLLQQSATSGSSEVYVTNDLVVAGQVRGLGFSPSVLPAGFNSANPAIQLVKGGVPNRAQYPDLSGNGVITLGNTSPQLWLQWNWSTLKDANGVPFSNCEKLAFTLSGSPTDPTARTFLSSTANVVGAQPSPFVLYVSAPITGTIAQTSTFNPLPASVVGQYIATNGNPNAQPFPLTSALAGGSGIQTSMGIFEIPTRLFNPCTIYGESLQAGIAWFTQPGADLTQLYLHVLPLA